MSEAVGLVIAEDAVTEQILVVGGDSRHFNFKQVVFGCFEVVGIGTPHAVFLAHCIK